MKFNPKTATNKRSTKPNSLSVHDSIGKTGNIQNEKSTEGVQYPFMPGCESYDGSLHGRDYQPGTVADNEAPNYDFLPKSTPKIK